jgi:hypothetical protein
VRVRGLEDHIATLSNELDAVVLPTFLGCKLGLLEPDSLWQICIELARLLLDWLSLLHSVQARTIYVNNS